MLSIGRMPLSSSSSAVEQRLDRLALVHGEGVVDHQHHVDGHGLAGLQRLDREDPPLADAPGDREVLDLQVADRIARRVDHRNDGLLRGARGVDGDLRVQRGGLDPDVLDRLRPGGPGQSRGRRPASPNSSSTWALSCSLVLDKKTRMPGAATGLTPPAGRPVVAGRSRAHIPIFSRLPASPLHVNLPRQGLKSVRCRYIPDSVGCIRRATLRRRTPSMAYLNWTPDLSVGIDRIDRAAPENRRVSERALRGHAGRAGAGGARESLKRSAALHQDPLRDRGALMAGHGYPDYRGPQAAPRENGRRR